MRTSTLLPAMALALLAGCGEIEVNFVLNREGVLPAALEHEQIRQRVNEYNKQLGEGQEPQSAKDGIDRDDGRRAKREEAMRRVLYVMFGTPDEPYAWGAAGLDQKKLELAAGPSAERTGLYRKHCAHCHGVSGDGAGPTARFLNPYPRDYRQGLFKFKSTYPTGAMPTRGDLVRTINEGLNGTAMPAFKVMLRDDEIEALAEYVVYLSMRGMAELDMKGVIDDLDVDHDTELTDELLGELIAGLPPGAQSDAPRAFARWLSVEEGWRKYQDDPAGFVENQRELEEDLEKVYAQIEKQEAELKKLTAAQDAEKKEAKKEDAKKKDAGKKDGKKKDAAKDDQEQIEKVQKELAKLRSEEQSKNQEIEQLRNTYFVPPARNEARIAEARKVVSRMFNDPQRANCAQCHGPTGLGDGGQINFDTWNQPKFDELTKRKRPPDELAQMFVLPLQRTKPRNLRLGIYRGGRRPGDLYRRIAIGINGSPMPAHAAANSQDKKKLQPHEIWALVEYVLSLPYQEDGERQTRPEADRQLKQRL